MWETFYYLYEKEHDNFDHSKIFICDQMKNENISYPIRYEYQNTIG